MCCTIRNRQLFSEGLSWGPLAHLFQKELEPDHDGLTTIIQRAIDKAPLKDPEAILADLPKLSTLPKVFPSFPTARKTLEVFLKILKEPLEKALKVPLKPLKNVNLITLAYLKGAYTEGADTIMPFTRDFMLACQASKAANDRAEQWLLCKGGRGWRGWLAVAAAAVAGFVMSLPFPLINKDADPQKIAIAAPIVTAIGVSAGAAFGMIFTGTQPHEASVTANTEQTHIDLLAERFNGTAKELIDLYFSPVAEEKALAIQLATAIDIEKIRKDYRLLPLQKDTDGEVLNELDDAVEYIKSRETPTLRPGFIFMSALSTYIRGAEQDQFRPRAPYQTIIDTPRLASFATTPDLIAVSSLPA